MEYVQVENGGSGGGGASPRGDFFELSIALLGGMLVLLSAPLIRYSSVTRSASAGILLSAGLTLVPSNVCNNTAQGITG